MKEFIQDVHYYLEDTRVIFTEQYHIERGECCNNGCRHCPWKNKKSILDKNTTGSLFINE